jgi:hypothetical protein
MSQGSKKLSDLFFDEHSMSGFNVNSLLDDGNTVDAGLAMKPKIVSSLEQTKGDILEDLLVNASEGQGNIGLQGSMGIASSPRTTGKVLDTKSVSLNNSCYLSLIETDTQSHYPSIEEVIAFGGIQKPTGGVRSSTRLGSHPNADMPIMEKAMKQAMIQDDALNSGQLSIPKYSIVNIPDSEIVKRVDRLGVSLGKSHVETGKSIKGIKMVEEEIILTILKKNEIDIDNRDEGLETLVLSKVSNLSEDLCEDDDILLDFDDHLEHLKPVVKVKKNRHRKVYDTSNIRKSTRKRIKKQY